MPPPLGHASAIYVCLSVVQGGRQTVRTYNAREFERSMQSTTVSHPATPEQIRREKRLEEYF